MAVTAFHRDYVQPAGVLHRLCITSTADCRLLQRSCTCLMEAPDQPMLASIEGRIVHNISNAGTLHRRTIALCNVSNNIVPSGGQSAEPPRVRYWVALNGSQCQGSALSAQCAYEEALEETQRVARVDQIAPQACPVLTPMLSWVRMLNVSLEATSQDT